MSQGTLSGYDFLTDLGLTITDGIQSFLAYAKRKASVQHDWPEVDGIDIDLSQPTFQARQFTLSVIMVAGSRADFKTKYYGLFTILKQEGILQLYFSDLDQTFYVYFIEQQNIKKLTRRIDSNKVSVKFDLVFGEINPEDNVEDVFIVTENDEFIIA